jgi:hypothetical protein
VQRHNIPKLSAWLALEVASIYAIVVVSLFLSLLAIAFAYRLSRITGLFSAWVLLIAGLALTSFEDFAFFSSVIFVGYGKVQALVETYTWGSFLFILLILIGIPLLFALSMYKLHALFRAQRKSDDGGR